MLKTIVPALDGSGPIPPTEAEIRRQAVQLSAQGIKASVGSILRAPR